MNNVGIDGDERILDIREIEPRVRHTIIFQLFEHLDEHGGLQLITDHDPRRLRFQLETKYGDRCGWAYLERGPDLWRVRLARTQPESGT